MNKSVSNLTNLFCGKKAVPLSLLGAEVTVFDISEDNKRYALEVAEAANTKINYVVGDVLEINEFMQVVYSLLKLGGKIVCSDFHPFTKIQDILHLENLTMDYFSTDIFEGEMAHARFFPEEIRKKMPKCSYRKYTMSEIINGVINSGFTLIRFDEHPAWTNDKVPGEFTVVAVKNK